MPKQTMVFLIKENDRKSLLHIFPLNVTTPEELGGKTAIIWYKHCPYSFGNCTKSCVLIA
jgi:hypothetical protein